MRSSGCSSRVDVMPPLTPATKCSYFTWENMLNFGIFLGDDVAGAGVLICDDGEVDDIFRYFKIYYFCTFKLILLPLGEVCRSELLYYYIYYLLEYLVEERILF